MTEINAVDSDTYFFSYARTDAEFVLKLARDLRSAGVKIWMDQLDIIAGQHWDLAVEKALDASKKMILILSPNSVVSNNVMDEVSYAMGQGDNIVPVLMCECKIPLRWARLHHIDFTSDYDVAFKQLLGALNINETNSFSDTLPQPEVSDNTLSANLSTSSTQSNLTPVHETIRELDDDAPSTQKHAKKASPHQTNVDSSQNETVVQSLHVMVQWDDEIREFTGDFTIGRDKSNAIQLKDPQVSRQHAAVTMESGGWVLSDLGSRNGVRLNGKLIKKTELPQEATVQLHMYGTPLLIRVI